MTVAAFGSLIVVNIDFYDFISQFSLSFGINCEDRKDRQYLPTFSNSSMFVKGTPLYESFF